MAETNLLNGDKDNYNLNKNIKESFNDNPNEKFYPKKKLILNTLALSSNFVKNITFAILFYISLKNSEFPDTNKCKEIEIISTIFINFLGWHSASYFCRIILLIIKRKKNNFFVVFQFFKALCYWIFVILFFIYYNREIDCSHIGQIVFIFLIFNLIVITCLIFISFCRLIYLFVFICHDGASNAQCTTDAILASSGGN